MPNLFQPPFTDLHAFYDRHIGPIVVALVVGLIALRVSRLFVRGIVKALMDREAAEGTAGQLTAVEMTKRIATIELLATSVIQFFIVAIVGLWVLQTAAGLDIGPAIAGLGIAGVALGFGAQSLVKDYLNGALILIENHYSKGDVVRIAGVSGTVEDLSLRRTTLRDLDGTVHGRESTWTSRLPTGPTSTARARWWMKSAGTWRARAPGARPSSRRHASSAWSRSANTA